MKRNGLYEVGDHVRAKVNAQGMVLGAEYIVTNVTQNRNFLGTYTYYTLMPVDPKVADPDRPVGNGHLVLEYLP